MVFAANVKTEAPSYELLSQVLVTILAHARRGRWRGPKQASRLQTPTKSSAFVFSLTLSLTVAMLSWLNLDYKTRFGLSHVTSTRMQ